MYFNLQSKQTGTLPQRKKNISPKKNSFKQQLQPPGNALYLSQKNLNPDKFPVIQLLAANLTSEADPGHSDLKKDDVEKVHTAPISIPADQQDKAKDDKAKEILDGMRLEAAWAEKYKNAVALNVQDQFDEAITSSSKAFQAAVNVASDLYVIQKERDTAANQKLSKEQKEDISDAEKQVRIKLATSDKWPVSAKNPVNTILKTLLPLNYKVNSTDINKLKENTCSNLDTSYEHIPDKGKCLVKKQIDTIQYDSEGTSEETFQKIVNNIMERIEFILMSNNYNRPAFKFEQQYGHSMSTGKKLSRSLRYKPEAKATEHTDDNLENVLRVAKLYNEAGKQSNFAREYAQEAQAAVKEHGTTLKESGKPKWDSLKSHFETDHDKSAPVSHTLRTNMSGRPKSCFKPAIAEVQWGTDTYAQINHPQGLIPKKLNPLISEGLRSMDEKDICKYSLMTNGAGSHAEVYAANKALTAKEVEKLSDIPTDGTVKGCICNMIKPNESQNQKSFAQCPHCKKILIGVTPTLFHDEVDASHQKLSELFDSIKDKIVTPPTEENIWTLTANIHNLPSKTLDNILLTIQNSHCGYQSDMEPSVAPLESSTAADILKLY